ncbi:hypothetical protein CDAR_492001 [Caerostris darwini]|uniref:Uncharacterized protein n=1 Tax=Caerostris darwini TaxID=1538125 RepID=A0AAV4VJK6_9ARAC|nr:hypothetical protein CDAR_492001 [Caerostris darwini]
MHRAIEHEPNQQVIENGTDFFFGGRAVFYFSGEAVVTVVTSLSTDKQSGFGGAPRRACEMKEKGDALPVRSGKQHVFPSGAVNGRISAVERLPDDHDHRLP